MRVFEFKQYSPEWWESHRGRPSASNFGKIITPAKADFSKSAIDYVYELIAELYDRSYGRVEEYVTAAMRNGTIMEPESRRFYEMERDCDVRQVGICESDCGRFICSPDSLCGDDGVLELKNPTYKTQIRYLHQNELPNEHKVQCHGLLLVTKRNWCDFLSYAPGLPPLLIRVVPDEFTLKLANALEQFWRLYSDVKASIQLGGDPVAATREAFVSPY